MGESAPPKRQEINICPGEQTFDFGSITPGTQSFKLIRHHLGQDALHIARQWENRAKQLSNTQEQLTFLHNCRRANVLPKCISYSPPVKTDMAKRIVLSNGKRMMSALINDCHHRCRFYTAEIERHRTAFTKQANESATNHIQAAIRLMAQRQRSKHNLHLGIKLTQRIKTSEFITSDETIHNLSSKLFTPDELEILNIDVKYNMSDARPLDFIASLESLLLRSAESEDLLNSIRQQVTTLLTNHRNQYKLTKQQRQTLKKLKKDPEIVILPADKGRATVILDQTSYKEKMSTLLSDPNAYRITKASAVSTFNKNINSYLWNLKTKNILTYHEWKSMRANEAPLARIYGLPKIHKEGIPLRPIVSLRGTPTYGLAQWLLRKLKWLTNTSQTTVKSSTEFLTRLKGMHLEEDEVMVSFDVVSLFTTIPQDLMLTTIANLLRSRYEEDNKLIKIETFMTLIQFALKTCFTFDECTYEQIKGTPMGSPLSGLIAEAVLQRLEVSAFSSKAPKFWARYVDDTFAILKRSEVNTLHETLNQIFTDIQFTIEEEHEGKLAFLDVLIDRIDGRLETRVFRKKTDTNRLLHYTSNHPVSHKRSCVRSLFGRISTHCSSEEAKLAEEKYLKKIFSENGYPPRFIQRCVKGSNIKNDSQTPFSWIALPYIEGVSEATARLVKQLKIGIAHKPMSTIRSAIMHPKDRVNDAFKTNVVYNIPCGGCSNTYVGQTGRRLKTRMAEHQSDIRRQNPDSQVAEHVYHTGHTFKFNEVQIIDSADKESERLVKEAWFSTGDTINHHVDLHPAYQALRQALSQRVNYGSQVGSNQRTRAVPDCQVTLTPED